MQIFSGKTSFFFLTPYFYNCARSKSLFNGVEVSRKKVQMNIYTCARAGDLNQVKFFTEEVGVELNVTDEWDGTPLYYACLGGHIKIVEYLLSRGRNFLVSPI